jgi:hypothetical protein
MKRERGRLMIEWTNKRCFKEIRRKEGRRKRYKRCRGKNKKQ